MKIQPPFYTQISTAFGTIGIVWHRMTGPSRVWRICLNPDRQPVADVIRRIYPDAQPLSSPEIERFASHIQRFLEGEAVVFNLDMVAMENCKPFQRQVLLTDYEIPRGHVNTYGNIARRIGITGGSRATGQALAQNPFPLVIPCHRVVRADGGIGGYRGGADMKRALLTMEGVAFTGRGTVAL